MPRENSFQSNLIKELKSRFADLVILKNDANYIQGFPDLTLLYKDRWAVLECKRGKKENHQPNQDYYVDRLNSMSFSRFIFPENKNEVIDELTKFFSN